MAISSKNRAEMHLRIVKEIGELLSSSAEAGSLLKSLVDHLGRSLGYDVVSLYLWDEKIGKLVMLANQGLTLQADAPVMLLPDEGLVGTVFANQQPMSVAPASQHPKYKFFPELGEKAFETFIGVPVMFHRRCLGVLVVQAREEQDRNTSCEELLEIVASRVAHLIEVGGRIDQPGMRGGVGSSVMQGIGVSSGIAPGPVFRLQGVAQSIKGKELDSFGVEREFERLDQAAKQVDEDLGDLVSTLLSDSKLSEAELAIFRAQRQLLTDPMFQEGLRKNLAQFGGAAEWAVQQTVEQLCEQFAALGPSFFRERLFDLKDIEEKLLRVLLRERGLHVSQQQPEAGSILIAHEVGPSQMIAYSDLLAGVVTEVGGEGGHMAILARSLGIPAITGIENLMETIRDEDLLLVDGRTGFLFVNPSEVLRRDYDVYRAKQEEVKTFLREGGKDLEGCVFPLRVSANIGFPGDLASARNYGLQDVGLFRSEFSYMQSSSWPSIEEQTAWITEIQKELGGLITLRTLDIGSDKQLPYFAMPREENPMLGMRSVRFSMENTRQLKDQLHAVIDARLVGADVRVLLPMVTQLWEVDTVREMLDTLISEHKISPSFRPSLGMMVEVPGVYWLLDHFLRKVDFLSIGTNDLVQYLLAVDRNSAHVGHLYCEHHPVVIRFLNDLLRKVRSHGKSVTICGEMAGSPVGILILLALGFDHLSVLPQRASVVRFIARRLTSEKLMEIRKFLLQESNAFNIQNFLIHELEGIHPDLLLID